MVANMRQAALGALFDLYLPPGSIEEQWDAAGLEKALEAEYQLQAPLSEWMKAAPDAELDALREQLIALGEAHYQAKGGSGWETTMRQFDTPCCCNIWISTGANTWPRWTTCARAFLRGYAQRTPSRNTSAGHSSCSRTCWIRSNAMWPSCCSPCAFKAPKKWPPWKPKGSASDDDAVQHADFDAALRVGDAMSRRWPAHCQPDDDNPFSPEALAAQGLRVGRNDRCPCGSGREVQADRCHGKLG